MIRSHSATNRTLAIQRVQERLVSDSFPRIQMTLLLALTGAFGLLASFSLLKLGMNSMSIRYPLALAFAYAFFLFLIWLWLRTKADDCLDLANCLDPIPQRHESTSLPDSAGGSGSFGGGGASAFYRVWKVFIPLMKLEWYLGFVSCLYKSVLGRSWPGLCVAKPH